MEEERKERRERNFPLSILSFPFLLTYSGSGSEKVRPFQREKNMTHGGGRSRKGESNLETKRGERMVAKSRARKREDRAMVEHDLDGPETRFSIMPNYRSRTQENVIVNYVT